jgi:hypothetical protein
MIPWRAEEDSRVNPAIIKKVILRIISINITFLRRISMPTSYQLQQYLFIIINSHPPRIHILTPPTSHPPANHSSPDIKTLLLLLIHQNKLFWAELNLKRDYFYCNYLSDAVLVLVSSYSIGKLTQKSAI